MDGDRREPDNDHRHDDRRSGRHSTDVNTDRAGNTMDNADNRHFDSARYGCNLLYYFYNIN